MSNRSSFVLVPLSREIDYAKIHVHKLICHLVMNCPKETHYSWRTPCIIKISSWNPECISNILLHEPCMHQSLNLLENNRNLIMLALSSCRCERRLSMPNNRDLVTHLVHLSTSPIDRVLSDPFSSKCVFGDQNIRNELVGHFEFPSAFGWMYVMHPRVSLS